MTSASAADFPLPQIHSSLIPYIKSRQEAQKIRQALTLSVASSLEPVPNTHDAALHVLCPDGSHQAAKIPSELRGLRREYLKALKANSSAQKEYTTLVSSEGEEKDRKTFTEPDSRIASEEHLQEYLLLLRQRRRYERLQILQDYLEVLTQKPSGSSDFLDIKQISTQLSPAPQPPATIIRESDSERQMAKEAHMDALVSRLEKAVLRNNHLLQSEKARLGEIQEKYGKKIGSPNQSTKTPTKDEIRALESTRNTLIGWVEAELAKTGDSMAAADATIPPAEAEASAAKLAYVEQRSTEIEELYRIYVESRRSLLETSNADVLPRERLEKDSVSGADNLPLQEGRLDPHAQSSSVIAFEYVRKHLLPLHHFQKSLLQSRTHVETCLTKEQKASSQALERLSDESHLLPAYPLLANQPRFKHAAAVLASRAVNRNASAAEEAVSGNRGAYGHVEQARAWAFAAEASGSNTMETVEQALGKGRAAVDSAQARLAALEALLNEGQETEQAQGNVPSSEGQDIWTADALSAGKKRHGHWQQKRRDAEASGADRRWRGINGQIGVIGRGT